MKYCPIYIARIFSRSSKALISKIRFIASTSGGGVYIEEDGGCCWFAGCNLFCSSDDLRNPFRCDGGGGVAIYIYPGAVLSLGKWDIGG
jgi:hypothetical protein